ncbi:MAG: hypothetical protein JRE40_01125 [Deltaproteobacteria bacterium]|nr:hypothetical protein [Deltaproteobacteria bacterium]
MTRPTITTCNAARCLAILKAAAEPIVAADLARRLDLAGERESQRRQVRAIITHLREQGEWIVAKMGGYRLTDDAALWAAYNADRANNGKHVIGQSHNRNKAAVDSLGQGLLFQPAAGCGIG